MNMRTRILLFVTVAVLTAACVQTPSSTRNIDIEYRFQQLNREISTGWNSYDARSLFTEVYLPECFGIKIFLQDSKGEVVDDNMIISNDTAHEPSAISGYAPLKAGTHSIRVIYFEDTNGQMLELELTSPSGKTEAPVMYMSPCR